MASFLDNAFVRIFLIITANVLAGYTLQPVPKLLAELFKSNILVKFGILVLVGVANTHFSFSDKTKEKNQVPNDDKLFYVVIAVIILLSVFEFIRRYYKD